MPVSINGSGSITGVSSLTQLTKLGVTGILTATDFSGPSGGAADFPNGLTATTASFSSNLSVGGNLTVDGVLTYDDVTNIDSVGVVTARAGVKVPDSQKIFLGTGDDLEIYHDGSSRIYNDTGHLIIRNSANDSDIYLQTDDGSGGVDSYVLCDGSSGKVHLYHYGSEKLQTKSDGIDVTGEVQCDSLDVDGIANIQSVLTMQNYIQGTTTLDLYGDSSANQGLSLDASGNVTLQANLDLQDNDKILLGNGDDLQIYHNGSANYIDNTSDLYVRVNGSETAIYATANGKVALNYDSSNRIETTATGVEVSGATKTDTLEVTQEYPTIRPTLDLNFAATKVLDDRITFTRDSVGTYVDENGILKYASNNTPRFDHDPTTGESLGLLIEESRTNILGLSSDLTDNNGNDWDNINGTISVNQTTAPDGTTTAASFTASAGNAEHSVVFAELVPTGNVTASVWVKPNTYSIVSFVLYGEANSTVSYNLSTKTVYNQGSNVSRATITEYPNGWYRISATMNCTVSNSRVYRLFASTGNFNAGGSESFYYWGPQVESGSFETSYIPTYASNTSVTRAADLATIKGTNFTDFYNQTESTLFVHYKLDKDNYLEAPAGVEVVSFRASGNTHGYDIRVVTDTSSPALDAHGVSNSVTQYDVSGLNLSSGFKDYLVAKAFKLNDMAVSFNGGALQTDSSLIVYEWDKLVIGLAPRRAHYKSIKYFNKRLPNAQLQGLTQQ